VGHIACFLQVFVRSEGVKGGGERGDVAEREWEGGYIETAPVHRLLPLTALTVLLPVSGG
jgi:hypothetical protein